MRSPKFVRGWRLHFGTTKIEKSTAHPRGDAFFSKCIPREVPTQQAETHQKAQQRIPLLYVPLRIFGCLGAVLEGCTVTICCTLFTNCCTPHANPKLMHFVNKLFANCCTPQKRDYDRPAPLPPFPYQVREQMQANVARAVVRSGCTTKICPAVPPPFPYKLKGTPRGEIMVNLMTEHEVSKRLNVSVASLRRWRLLGRGPAFLKIGSLVRYRPEDLDRWLTSLPTGGSNGPGYSPPARGEYG
jgi:hypothetical protein